MPDDAPILLDVTRLIWRRWKGRYPTGIDRVCLAYLSHFADRSQAVVQHKRFRAILDRDASRRLFDLLDGPPAVFRRKLPLSVLSHLGGFNDEGRGRLYLNIGHTGLNSTGFHEWIRRSSVRPVYLVHDLIPITHPQFCRTGESEKHRDRMQAVLTTGAGVIGNSQATLNELTAFAESEGLPNPPSIAAWLGVDPLPLPSQVEAVSRPTFVVLSTIEGRKNHLMLLELWSDMIDQMGSNTPRLLIVGQRGWEAETVFDLLDKSEKLRGHVEELNHCSDEELAQHLGSARALLFPSLAEGFGLPLLEALGMGVPAIASELPVFREIAGDIPDYFEADDKNAWEAAILDYAQPDSVARATQVERARAFHPPSWEAHFKLVETWLPSRASCSGAPA